MDVREKLVKIVCDAMEADGCIGHCNHPPCFEVERVVNALIANGVTVQEWVSVTEKLPEPFVSVLIYAPNSAPLPTVHEAYLGHDDIWHLPYVYDVQETDVTHWLPMPEPSFPMKEERR